MDTMNPTLIQQLHTKYIKINVRWFAQTLKPKKTIDWLAICGHKSYCYCIMAFHFHHHQFSFEPMPPMCAEPICVCVSCRNCNCIPWSICLKHCIENCSGSALFWKLIYLYSYVDYYIPMHSSEAKRQIHQQNVIPFTIFLHIFRSALIVNVWYFFFHFRIRDSTNSVSSLFDSRKIASNAHSTGNLLIKPKRTTEYIFNLRFWFGQRELCWNTSSFYFSIFSPHFVRYAVYSAWSMAWPLFQM